MRSLNTMSFSQLCATAVRTTGAGKPRRLRQTELRNFHEELARIIDEFDWRSVTIRWSGFAEIRAIPQVGRAACGQQHSPRYCPPACLFFLNDNDRNFSGDLLMEAHRHLVLAELLNWFLKLDLPAVNGEIAAG
jgi:hypothetical protein